MLYFLDKGVAATTVVASTPDTWTPDRNLPLIEVLGVYVGLPVLLFAVISILALAPSWTRSTSYRPGLSWWAAPQWFGAEPAGGVDKAAKADGDDQAEPGERGGVSARW